MITPTTARTLHVTTHEHEWATGMVTIRVSVDEGIVSLALDRRRPDGRTGSIGLPLDAAAHAWLIDRLMEVHP